jgi:hypothetical protein
VSDDQDMPDRLYTTKQMGDAGEMLVAAELTLAGVPALKVADNWPGYDVVAQPPDSWPGYGVITQSSERTPQRVSVKSRTKGKMTYVGFDPAKADWLAIVYIDNATFPARRRFYIIPMDIANERSYAKATGAPRGLTVATIVKQFAYFENNFKLERRAIIE